MSEERIRFSQLAGFTEKQKFACGVSKAHQYTLFGGSRGPGKSYLLRWWLAAQVLRLRKEFGIPSPVVGLFSEDYPTLRDRQISKIASEFPAWLGEVKATQEQGLGFHVTGGGMIALRNLDDPAKYKSAEFAAIAVEELTMNGKETFDLLRGSLRWPGVPAPRFLAATNPGGRGHLWVKDLWIDGIFPPEMEPLRPEFAFVPALPTDNSHLDEAYWQMLDTLPPDLARAWRWGDWDVFEGQAFGEWRRHIHVIEPCEIPATWPRWQAVDWGYAKPFCCLWMARDPDSGQSLVYRELYKAGLSDPEQAQAIKAMGPAGRITLGDPSMWTQRTLERQTVTTAQVYAKNGVVLTRADNDRLTGMRRVRDALRVVDGRPGLLVFSTCTNLIRTLPALPYDKVNVEDVDTDAEDHAYDALRYGLSWKVLGKRRAPDAGRDVWRQARHGTS